VDELLAAPAPGEPDAYSASQWRRLAERCLRDRQTVILESIFLQNSVMPAFIDGAPAATVNQACTEIQRQAAPAEAWEPVVSELYERYPFPKLMVPDPQHDWPAALRAICAAVRP